MAPAVIDALDLLAEIALFQRQYERALRLSAATRMQRRVLGLVAFPPPGSEPSGTWPRPAPHWGRRNSTASSRDGAGLSLATPSATRGAAAASMRAPPMGGAASARSNDRWSTLRATD